VPIIYFDCVSIDFTNSLERFVLIFNRASNVNDNSASPFTFYDRNCGPDSTTSSVVSSSQTSSEPHPTGPTNNTSSGYPYPTGTNDSTSSEEPPYPTGPKNTSSGYPYPTETKDSTSSEQQPYPTDSEMTSSSSYIVSSSTSVESPVITSTPVYTSEHPTESPETVISYIDVTITSCPPEVTACPTHSNGGSPPSSSSYEYPISYSSSSSSVVGPIGSSSYSDSPTSYPMTSSATPTQSSEAPEVHTTIITTHYVGICPTGYTTIPYTTTVVTSPGASSSAVSPSDVPAGFTTTVAVCPACNSASPTVTLTIPVVSVIPIPVTSDSPLAESTPAGYSSAISPSGYISAGAPPAEHTSSGSPPAGPSSEVSPEASSSPAGYGPSAPAPEVSSAAPTGYTPSSPSPHASSAPPTTDLSPKPTASSPGYSNAVPTIATPPYNAGNSTASFKTAPASAGSKTTGASSGLSGAEATRPAAYTGGASKATEGTFVAVVVAAIWAGLVMV
jgi:chitinase